jgi:O-antigen ligase
VGLALYLALLGLVVARCRRLWREREAPAQARAFALGTAAATVALVLHSVTVNSLLLPFLMEPLWLMAGIVYLYARAQRAAVRPAAG